MSTLPEITRQRFETFPTRYPSIGAYHARFGPAYALQGGDPTCVPDSILEQGRRDSIEPEALALRVVQSEFGRGWRIMGADETLDNTRAEIQRERARGADAPRVVVVILPRDNTRAPFTLAPCTPTEALDALAHYHAADAADWEAFQAADVDAAPGESVECYTLRESVDVYAAGVCVWGVWDTRYTDDTAERRPMLRILAGCAGDAPRILRPYTAPGIVRVATLDDVDPIHTDKRVARAWEFLDGGLDNASYFRGCGADGADDVATGCGNSAREALADALEMLASDGWDVGACAVAIPADNPGAWDADKVGEALAEQAEPARLRVRFVASCGMDTAEGGEFDSADDALESVRSILAKRARLSDFDVDPIGEPVSEADALAGAAAMAKLRAEIMEALAAHDDSASWEWEARAGESWSMIPDTDGTLALSILPGVSADTLAEDSELHYYVSVRVSEASEELDSGLARMRIAQIPRAD